MNNYTVEDIRTMTPEEHDEVKTALYREVGKGLAKYMVAKSSIYVLIWYVGRCLDKKVKR